MTRAAELAQVASTIDTMAAETAAGLVVGTSMGNLVNQGYAPGNMLRYGADPTGATDSSPAFNSAIAQRQHNGERIVFPAGLYKGNFVVTGQYIDILFEHTAYEDTSTIGFIANNLANPIWQIGDGSTVTTSIRLSGGLKMHGQGTAAKGLLINGVQNCWIDGLIVRGFTNFCVSYTASTTRPTSYVWIRNYRIDPVNGGANAIGLVITQPANYPTSYATAFYLDSGAISAVSGTLWAIQINANSRLQVSNSYWSMLNNVGINFSDAGNTGVIICDNLTIDTLGTSNDVLVTCAGTSPLPLYLAGIYTLNGKISINGVVSTTTLQSGAAYIPYRHFLHQPSIVGNLDFQDTGAAAANQTVYAAQPITISRSGNSLFVVNTAGAVLVESSTLELFNGAGNADGNILFGTSSIKILTGAGSPASSVSDGSLYLQTNAGAASPLWVRQNGAWVNVTLP